MKYLIFDYESLLRDYNTNKDALKSIEKQIDYFETGQGVEYGALSYWDIIKNPETMEELHNKKSELKLYVALCDNALSGLQESERNTLKCFYIEGLTSEQSADKLGCSIREFFRIKALAFDKFKHIVYWQ
jgi:DNA-directed RNA polymerase specialized sigma24 family protein